MLNREFVSALAEKCPAYRAHLPDCPLSCIRAAGEAGDLHERLDHLSDEAIDDLIRGHFLCLCRRDGCEI